MDEFKLRSINEFDEDFAAEVKALRTAKASPAVPPVPQQKKETLIPEMSRPAVEEPVEIDFFGSDPIPAPAAPVAPVPPITPIAPAAPAAPAVPPVSLYKTEKTDSSSVKPFVYEPQKFEDDDDDDYYKNTDTKDRTKLFLAGKIISIVMLAVTLLLFIFGCFITIFYDNKDSSAAGCTFSSLAKDNAAISSSKNGNPEKAGALIISKKVKAEDYKSGDLIAVPADEAGCDIYQVVSISNETSDGFDLIVVDTNSDSTASLTVASEDIFGKAVYSLGGLGKLVSFATSNLVLVCILFLLLAAFWCILIVLIEKIQAKQNEEEEDNEEDVKIR